MNPMAERITEDDALARAQAAGREVAEALDSAANYALYHGTEVVRKVVLAGLARARAMGWLPEEDEE